LGAILELMGAIDFPHANGRRKFQYLLKLFKYHTVPLGLGGMSWSKTSVYVALQAHYGIPQSGSERVGSHSSDGLQGGQWQVAYVKLVGEYGTYAQQLPCMATSLGQTTQVWLLLLVCTATSKV